MPATAFISSFTRPFTDTSTAPSHSPSHPLHPHFRPVASPRRRPRCRPLSAPCCSAAAAPGAYTLWQQVRVAVPLSRAFEDALGSDVLTRLSSTRFKLVCPFHSDRNPSLHVDDDLGLFHCFACGAKGSIIDLQQRLDGHHSIARALRALAAKYPPIATILRNSAFNAAADDETDGTQQQPTLIQKQRLKQKVSRRVRITQSEIASDALKAAATLYTDAFWSDKSPDALHYLSNVRHLSAPTLHAFSCGFAPPHPRRTFIIDALTSSGIDRDDLVLAGLARVASREDDDARAGASGSNDRYYDVFYNRLVIPIKDRSGKILSYASRSLSTSRSSKVPKYINGPESPIFSKRSVLFGADLAATASSATVDDGFVILVEGYLDVMALFDKMQGRVACVCTMGTAASPTQLRAAQALLADPVDGKVIINFDADDAGVRALERLCDDVIPLVNDCAHAFYIALPPPYIKDVDEFLSQAGAEPSVYIEHLFKEAVPWYQWRGDRIVRHEVERLQELWNEKIRTAATSSQKQKDDQTRDVPVPSYRSTTPTNGSAADDDFRDVDIELRLLEFMDRQSDEFAIAFGANPKEIYRQRARQRSIEPPPCSDAVLEELADIIARASKCLPGLNVSALAQSWVDSLSFSRVTVLVPLFKRLIALCEKRTRDWRYLSSQAQMYWEPLPPWVRADMPAWKLRQLGLPANNASANASPLPPSFTAGADLADAEAKISAALTDSSPPTDKATRRSNARADFQAEHVLPFLKGRTPPAARRMDDAPRVYAEETVLRALIFAPEPERLDALAALIDILIRCAERGLPFWTNASRERLFEHIAALDGPTTPHELAAYLEEFDWFTPDLECLFEEDDEDYAEQWLYYPEWTELRALELMNPIDTVRGTANAIEGMAKIVASRTALDDSSEVLAQLVQAQGDTDEETDEIKKAELQNTVDSLTDQHRALAAQIDGSKFWSEEEAAQRKEEEEKVVRDEEARKVIEEAWRHLKETGSFPPPPSWARSTTEAEGAADEGTEEET